MILRIKLKKYTFPNLPVIPNFSFNISHDIQRKMDQEFLDSIEKVIKEMSIK